MRVRGGRTTTLITGEIAAAAPSDFASARCARCGTTTSHARDPTGGLHCRRCVLEESVPPTVSVDHAADDRADTVDAWREPQPARWAAAAIIAALVAIAVLFVYRAL